MLRALLLALPLALLAATAGTCPAEEPLRPEVSPALAPLAAWLEHQDPVLRALAAFELRHHAAEGAVLLARTVLEREREDTVLGCALGSLEGRPRADLVAEGGARLPGLLLRLLEHPHPVLRDRALAALRRFAHAAPPGGPTAWRRWWLERREELDQEQQTLLALRRSAAEATRPAPLPRESRTGTGPEEEDLYGYVVRLRRDGLEVVIVMDHTGSMAPVIGAARRRAAALVRRLAHLVPRFRAGLVTYDDAARLRLALTTDGEALEDAFRRVTASGGGDWEEGVDKGVALALRQDRVAWSRRAHRVIVVIGDAPPHAADVPGLLRRVRAAREDVLYEHPVRVHAVSTWSGGVDHFGLLAVAGGGVHVTLQDMRRLEAELVALTFGAGFRDRVGPWLEEIEHLRRAAPTR